MMYDDLPEQHIKFPERLLIQDNYLKQTLPDNGMANIEVFNRPLIFVAFIF